MIVVAQNIALHNRGTFSNRYYNATSRAEIVSRTLACSLTLRSSRWESRTSMRNETCFAQSCLNLAVGTFLPHLRGNSFAQLISNVFSLRTDVHRWVLGCSIRSVRACVSRLCVLHVHAMCIPFSFITTFPSRARLPSSFASKIVKRN